MKLLFCSNCQDIVRLFKEEKRFCKCGQSCGWYVDSINAEYFGPFCVPIGIANATLMNALIHRPQSGSGARFVAFVMPHDCETFKPMLKKDSSCDFVGDERKENSC